MRTLTTLLISILFSFLQCFSSGIGEYGTASRAMVVSEHHLASQVGVDILRKGGNAVDAAVATGFALAVVYPEAGNIGGGGFMVIWFPDNTATSIDFREAAPLATHENIFIDDEGKLQGEWSRIGARAAGVPGTVAGLLMAWEKYGSLPLETIVNPAVQLAREGFQLTTQEIRSFYSSGSRLNLFNETAAIFYPDGKPLSSGSVFKQEDLAQTLERIRDNGYDGFYHGETAALIVGTMEKYDGWITPEDLRRYRAVERQTVRGTYRDYEIISMGPPSSGGIVLLQMLNILENFEVGNIPIRSVEFVRLLSESMKTAFLDRWKYLGDPDYVSIPKEMLLDKDYAYTKKNSIIRSDASIYWNIDEPLEQTQTTHYNVVDENGMVASVTTTVNSLFGSKLIVDGAGFFLNNQMNDFALQPRVRDQFGLLGSEANKIEPGKRMLSSMTPTIILKNNKPFLIIGGRGGPRIITSLVQLIINVVDYNMDLKEAMAFPRIHHQWSPDRLEYNPRRISFRQRNVLTRMGYRVIRNKAFGRVVAVLIDNGAIYGALDLFSNGGVQGY